MLSMTIRSLFDKITDILLFSSNQERHRHCDPPTPEIPSMKLPIIFLGGEGDGGWTLGSSISMVDDANGKYVVMQSHCS